MFTVNIKQAKGPKMIIIIQFNLFLLMCRVNGQMANYKNGTTQKTQIIRAIKGTHMKQTKQTAEYLNHYLYHIIIN
jgi:hypothetical protein